MPTPKNYGRLKNTKPPAQFKSLIKVDEVAYTYADLMARTGRTYESIRRRISVVRSRGKVTWADLGFPNGEPAVIDAKIA